MSKVQRSAYRQPATPSGLESIEKGTLTWLDEDMYNNLNTGVLEQYLEEKNLQDSFEISHWDTRKVLIGIFIGAIFSGYCLHWTQDRTRCLGGLVCRLLVRDGPQMVSL